MHWLLAYRASFGNLCAALACIGVAQVTPAKDSALRKAILDAARKPVSKALNNKPVLFKVDHLKVQGAWAFVKGVPLQPSGKPMSYKGTQYQPYIDQGIFDDWFCALLQKQNGKWSVRAWSLGATDVPWVDWPERFKAPKSVFPPYGQEETAQRAFRLWQGPR